MYYKRNLNAPSQSHCCRGRLSINYSKRVCILATFLLRIMLLREASMFVPHFATLSH